MKPEKLVGDRFRERPSDCIVDSHALMVQRFRDPGKFPVFRVSARNSCEM